MKQVKFGMRTLPLAALFLFVCSLALPAYAQESLCASVRIEIVQELAFERQGFDANMRINNALEGISLENVEIDVLLMDENNEPVLASSDPENTEALFFIRQDSLSGIDAVDGSGTIEPGTLADIHWLIVPSPGAAGSSPNGTLYYAGAKLKYTVQEEEIEIDVNPDYIYVKPLPLLTLDYFLPRDVYADDAFTTIIEPPIPFDLGVRITNNGFGVAGNMSTDSAQPKIIDNELGLLIDFKITGSSLNDLPVEPTLLIPFGDLGAREVISGRWIMETTLSGEFVEFSAEYSHADELGGELTSLLEDVRTHELIHNVRVDLAGRDAVRDFLAKDGATIRVYESSGLDTEVTDQSSTASLTWTGLAGEESSYNLAVPPTDGFLYVKLPDPHSGTKVFSQGLRSDGKSIPAENMWLSQTRREDNGWDYFVHFFDVNSPGKYQLVMTNKFAEPVPPVIQFIPDKQVVPGNQVSFIVEASDLNSTLPTVTMDPLPSGAQFFPDTNGQPGISTYIFDWTPTIDQAGSYPITVTATDGSFITTQLFEIRVCGGNDSDCDGMDDDWELENFGTLNRDGTGDFDNDGFTDLQEYLNGTNPLVQDPPSIPAIVAPFNNETVQVLQPLLEVENAIHGESEVDYEFELYRDEGLSDLVIQAIVSEQVETTVFDSVPVLQDNTTYYWRVRACNEMLCSEWNQSQFVVNVENEAPQTFAVESPTIGAVVDQLTPILSVFNSVDPDGDVLNYVFSVYEDEAKQLLVQESPDIQQNDSGITSWLVEQPLAENSIYYWDAVASDTGGLSTNLTEIGQFTVNTENSVPTTPTIKSPVNGETVTEYETNLEVFNSTDGDNDTLTYVFELDTSDTFDSPDLLQSNAIDSGIDSTAWFVDGLLENQTYYWRVRADDSQSQSGWVYAAFFVSQTNEAPDVPVISNPGDAAWVETTSPTLAVAPVTDPEGEDVSYAFELYSDESLTNQMASASGNTTEWTVPFMLMDNNWYYWRARAQDSMGNASDWTATSGFFVNDNGVDDAPTLAFTSPTGTLYQSEGVIKISWTDEDPDSNASVSLFWEQGEQNSGGTAIVENLSEDEDGNGDEFDWDVTGFERDLYYLYAIIDDGNTQVRVNANVTLYLGDTGQGSINLSPVQATLPACFVFEVSPGLEPRGAVTLSYSIDNSDATLQPAELTFDSENWNQPQSLSVSGLNNCELPDGLVGTITFTSVQSDDPAYDGLLIDSVPLIVMSDNIPPVANAGADITVEVSAVAILDGSLSTDEDNGPDSLTLLWQFVSVPAESSRTNADILFADAESASFIPDVKGDYELSLTVNDGKNSSTDTVIVTAAVPLGALVCDADGSGAVEFADIMIILANIGNPAQGDDDPMDPDRDGVITVLDVRNCQARL